VNGDHGEVLKSDGFEHISVEVIVEVLAKLRFVRRLWNETGYGYKGQEICYRIHNALRNTADELHHAASAKKRAIAAADQKCYELQSSFRSLRDEPRDTPDHSSLASQLGAFECGNVVYS
jgi:hypothetical protein